MSCSHPFHDPAVGGGPAAVTQCSSTDSTSGQDVDVHVGLDSTVVVEQRRGGALELTNGPDGTTFRVRLPLVCA
jgi:hypothetical protein